MVLDGLLTVFAFYLALPARFAGRPPQQWLDGLFTLLPLIILAFIGANYGFGLYHRIWRYATTREVAPVAASVAIATGFVAGADLLLPGDRQLPLGTVLLGGFFSLAGFLLVRFAPQLVRSGRRGSRGDTVRLLIVGAGQAGQMLGGTLRDQGADHHDLVGYIDDDRSKHGLRIHSARVLGGREAIPEVVSSHSVDLIAIAIINISGPDFREILDICEATDAGIKIVPDLMSFVAGSRIGPTLRDVTAEDLLGRGQVEIDERASQASVAGRAVLVTGAAGSIGAELCAQIAALGPSRLLALDNNESGLFDLTTLALRDAGVDVVPLIADVTDEQAMERVFEAHHPQVVFHAAAYKHVPLMEAHPQQAVRSNVMGTALVAAAASRYGAERFVLVSTDKAVEPSSVMGATKRVAEMLVLQRAEDASTLFTAVRFGNVLRSRGSVVPTFEAQIDQGGPVTVTHPDMTRYFMSITEAVRLIIQAGAFTQGGELFMLDMGEPISIDQLARRLIRLRGLRPDVDIEVAYVGMRPGEKLNEQLIASDEATSPTAHPSVLRVESPHGALRAEELGELQAAVESGDNDAIVRRLQAMTNAQLSPHASA